MNALSIPGVLFRSAYFTPKFSKHADKQCAGVQLHITDNVHADTFAAGLYLLEAIREMYPDDFAWSVPKEGPYHIDFILGTDAYRLGHIDARTLIESNRDKILAWQEETRAYRLY